MVNDRDRCSAAGIEERLTLQRINASDTVRLPCQLRPNGDIAVEPIL